MSYYSTPVMLSGAKTQGAPSLIENQQSLAAPINQHFVEWFSGDALDSIWTQTFVGSGSVAMDDVINGGVKLQTGSATNDVTVIEFEDVNHYSATGSVFITNVKTSNLTSNDVDFGFSQRAGSNHRMFIRYRQSTSTTELVTKDGTTINLQDLSDTPDTNWHNWKIQCHSTFGSATKDGDLIGITTSNLPTQKMSLIFATKTYTTAAKDMSIRYCEAYNT